MSDPQEQRATLLPYMLGAIGLMFFLTFLVVITGGFFFWVALITGSFAMMGWLHYVLWGKALMERTAGEREEMELLERARGENGHSTR